MLRLAIRQTGNIVRRQLSTSSILNCNSTTDIHTTYIEIPRYPVDKPQTLEKRKARLVYQSRKRGMLENDLLLSTFVGKYLSVLNENQTMMYDRLINGPSNDWDIFYWITEKQPTPKEYDNEIMDMLKEHAKNTDKVALRCPDLYV